MQLLTEPYFDFDRWSHNCTQDSLPQRDQRIRKVRVRKDSTDIAPLASLANGARRTSFAPARASPTNYSSGPYPFGNAGPSGRTRKPRVLPRDRPADRGRE